MSNSDSKVSLFSQSIAELEKNVVFRGSNHFHYHDMYMIFDPSLLVPKSYTNSRVGPVAYHLVNAEICHAFLQRFLLKGTYRPAPRL